MIFNSPSGPEIGLPDRKPHVRPGSTIAKHRVECVRDNEPLYAYTMNPILEWVCGGACVHGSVDWWR